MIRVTLRFKNRFWDTIPAPGEQRKTLSNMGFLFSDDEWLPTWWTTMPREVADYHRLGAVSLRRTFVRPRASHMSLSDVCRHSVDYSTLSLDHITPLLGAAYFHDWQNDPFSRGAYSYGAVGSDGAQEALGRPIREHLIFRG